jgi:hypothetical protein
MEAFPSFPSSTTHTAVGHQGGRATRRKHTRKVFPVEPDDLDVAIVRDKDDLIPLESISSRLRNRRWRHMNGMTASRAVRITLRMRRRRLAVRVTRPHPGSILVRGVYMRRRSVREEATDIAARDDLHQVATLNVPNLDKCRFERQDEGVVHGCDKRTRQSVTDFVVLLRHPYDSPNAVGKPSHWMAHLGLARHPVLLT